MGNDYLEGNYAPVRREQTITELAVTGTIPDHLDGRYLRNGPNPIAEIDPATYHWFTGDGMVHGMRMRDGKAQWYRNRWVRTPAVSPRALGENPSPREPIRRLELTSAPTPTSSATPAGRSRWSRAASPTTSSPTNWTPSARATSTAPCTGGYTAHPKRDPRHRRAARGVLLLGPRQQGAVLGDRRRRARAAHRGHRGHRQPDDARLLADREATSSSTTSRSPSTPGRPSR